MIKRITTLALFAVVGMSQILHATGADQFVLSASLPLNKAIDMAASGERVYVLGSGTLSILDSALPGPEFRVTGTLNVDKNMSEAVAFDRTVALSSPLGAVELYEQVGEQLVLRSRFDPPGSVVSMSLLDSNLCLAQGYSGVRVYDVADLTKPRLKQVFLEPDYAGGIDLSPEFLFVLDALNGVTVYSWQDGSWKYLDEIRTDVTPTDIGANRSGVGICFGTNHFEYWHCSSSAGAELRFATEFDFQPVWISGFRLTTDPFLLGSEEGDIAVYSSSTRQITARNRLGYPIEAVLVSDDFFPFPFIALDHSGSITAFKGDDLLARRKSFSGSESPASMLATENGLIGSTASGIELLSANRGSLVSHRLIPGAPIFAAMAESEPFLFAGSAEDGEIWIFSEERRSWRSVGHFDSELSLRQLFVRHRDDGIIELIAVGSEGARSITSSDAIEFAENWAVLPGSPTTCAAVSDNYLALSSEGGALELYSLSNTSAHLLSNATIYSRPRDLELVRDSFVVAAHPEGIEILAIESEGAHLSPLNSPPSVYSAFDLVYDESSRELIIADGSTGVKYLDFSDPARTGLAYSIPGTEDVFRISYKNGEFFALSASWLREYHRREPEASLVNTGGPISGVLAFPNPFNSSSEITVELDQSASLPLPVGISLVNVLGQTVAAENYELRERQMHLSLAQLVGENHPLSSGIYFFVVRAPGQVVTRKLLLLK